MTVSARTPTSDPMPRPLTPCRRICRLDPATGFCEGCGRTGAEIAAWGGLPEAERRRIMARLPGRLRAAVPGPPGAGT